MKSLLFILVLYLISFTGSSQDYFSKIIPTNDNPLIEVLLKEKNSYFISSDFFNSNGVFGGLIIVSNDTDDKVKFENMDLGLSPILIDDNNIYLVGENPINQGDSILFFSKINLNTLEIEWFKEYSCPIESTVNTTVKKIDDEFYILNNNNAGTDFINQRAIMIVKTDIDGNKIDKYEYNRDKRTTYGYELINTIDSKLIISSMYSKINEVTGTYSQLIKIDNNGDVIWNYEGLERLDNGAVPTWAVQLSDSLILQTYYVDKRNDVDFIVNNWFPEPNKFIWVNDNGELVKEKLIITEKQDFIYYDGLKKGKEDYFYAFGFYEDRRPPVFDQFFGHLTKFNNEGDTIWSRNYQHPSYNEGNITHNIRDILEEENGDIAILAEITPPGEKNEVWLFKVNSEGCFINQECEDMNVITSAEIPKHLSQKIYPNPTTGKVEIIWDEKMSHISVLNVNGQLLKKISVNSNKYNIDISDVESGMYIIQIQDEFNTINTQRVLKL